MKTDDVKVGGRYLYGIIPVKVLKRISGKETTKRIMQSGEMFTGFQKTRKRFLLDSEYVY